MAFVGHLVQNLFNPPSLSESILDVTKPFALGQCLFKALAHIFNQKCLFFSEKHQWTACMLNFENESILPLPCWLGPKCFCEFP